MKGYDSFSLLSDEQLLTLLKDAEKTGVDSDFINLIVTEVEKRKLLLPV